MRRNVVGLLIGITALGLSACGSDSATSEVTTSAGITSEVATSEASAPNSSMVDQPIVIDEITARIIGDGATFSLTAALAESPIALWFWAPG